MTRSSQSGGGFRLAEEAEQQQAAPTWKGPDQKQLHLCVCSALRFALDAHKLFGFLSVLP